MDIFQKEFMIGLFLENDHITTVNRSVMAMANIILENVENLDSYNEGAQKVLDPQSKINEDNCRTEALDVIKDYYERIVQNFSDEDYEATFNAKRTTVQALIRFLQAFVPPGIITLDKKVHIFFMLVMSDLSYNDIGKLFSLHKSTVSYIFKEIGSYLAENRFNYISWPSVEEQHVTRVKVNNRFKFPNCVGFIDTCHLKVGQKRTKHDTLLLQAVCDESLMFLDIHIGARGKTKKSRVFKDSTICRELQNFIEFDNHILGDSEYKLQINLITPFTSEELVTSEEMKFNEIHWKARSYIGHAFELLKEKFKKLNHIDTFKPESVNILIYSACVLHNFILIHEGCSEFKEEAIGCEDGVTLNTDIVMSSEEKRQFLCNYINYIDSDTEILNSR